MEGVNGVFVEKSSVDDVAAGISQVQATVFDTASMKDYVAQFAEPHFRERVRGLLRQVSDDDTSSQQV